MALGDNAAIARRRPGMFVGDPSGPHAARLLVWELVSNAVDQHLAKRCGSISITLRDTTTTVEDDGPGLSIAVADGVSFVERACLAAHDFATLDGHTPHVHTSGLAGAGLFSVCAFSSHFALETTAEGRRYRLVTERGIPAGPLEDLGPSDIIGTRVSFAPDPAIFTRIDLDRGVIAARLHEIAMCAPSLRITLRDERTALIQSPNGAADFLDRRVDNVHQRIVPSFSRRERVDDVDVDVALRWEGYERPIIHAFANFGPNTDGTHVSGLHDGVKAAVYSRARKLRRRILKVPRTSLALGMRAVVAVRLHDARYQNPTKDILASPEARAAVAVVTERLLTNAFEHDAALSQQLVERVTWRLPR